MVIVLAGLAGPLLAVSGRRFVPVVIGEVLAGIVVGPAVLDLVDPTDDTLRFLAAIGFAMLMLTVGMHLPLRDRRLVDSLRAAALLAALVGVLAVPAGLLAAAIAGTGHPGVYVVLLASGSAAVLIPALREARIDSADALLATAQVTIADVVTILAVPVVLDPGRVADVALGSALVIGCVIVLIAAARLVAGRHVVHRLRQLSKRRRWALDLRLSLLVLFFLVWVAQESRTSALIAGFGAGVMVAVLGGPKRLSVQTRGVADGFFIPLYFVLLGAGLDIGGILDEPSMLALVAALAGLGIAIRLLATAIVGRPPAVALATSAQLGVPAAVASLGLSQNVLEPQTATAIVVAALISLGVSTLGVDRLARTADEGQRNSMPSSTTR